MTALSTVVFNQTHTDPLGNTMASSWNGMFNQTQTVSIGNTTDSSTVVINQTQTGHLSIATAAWNGTFNQTQTGPLDNTTAAWNGTFNQTQTGPLGVDHIVSLAFVAVLLVLGAVGNIHCLVYYTKTYMQSKQPRHKKNSYTVFIISLAILDLVSCVFILPLDIADMSAYFTPLSEGLCRTFRFIQFHIHMSSILHICVISIHCWRQVGFPHSRQVTADMAIKCCIVASIVAILPAIPAIPVSGYTTITRNGVQGKTCKVSDDYADSCIPFIFLAVFIILFLISFIIISSSYVALIYFRYQRIKAKKVSEGQHPPTDGRDQTDEAEESRIRKSTRTLVIIMVIYFVTYMYFLLVGVATFSTDFAKSDNLAVLTLYRIISRLPFLNHVLNPMVYGWRDEKFRKKVKQFYKCE